MASISIRQVLPGSLDSAGISTATSTSHADGPRQGHLYNLTSLAAASPIWFYRLPGGRWLGLFSRRFTSAAPFYPNSSPRTLLYSVFAEDTSPSWAVFDPASGSVFEVGGIPSLDGWEMTAAVSRGGYLFVLARRDGQARILHFRIGRQSEPILQAQEDVPAELGLGLYAERNDIWVFGAQDGLLSAARKNWGRIGENSSPGLNMRWRYSSPTGWSSDPDDLHPLPGDIPAEGPVSIAKIRNRFYLTSPFYTEPVPAVAAVPGVSAEIPYVPGFWTAQAYTSRAVDSRWSKHPFSVPLGENGMYLGGTAALQPGLDLTSGYTTTVTDRGQTEMDAGSDFSQVFVGVASHRLVLPTEAVRNTAVQATYFPYSIYNKTVAGTLTVLTASGQEVASLRPGQSKLFTPVGPAPTQAVSWEVSDTETRMPVHRSGFPYVVTTRISDDGGRQNLLTAWGVFGV